MKMELTEAEQQIARRMLKELDSLSYERAKEIIKILLITLKVHAIIKAGDDCD